MSSYRQAAAQARAKRLWKDFFRDPSQWLDCRNSKTDPRDSDFRHKITKESLCLHGCHNPSWVPDMLKFEHLEEPTSQNVHQKYKNWQILSLDEALSSLEQGTYPLPSVEELACILQKCKKERSREHMSRMHAYAHSCGLNTHYSLGNSLVSMLAEVGSIHQAQQAFERLASRNECGWNSLIMGYCKWQEPCCALLLHQRMEESGESFYLNGHTLVALLKACALVKDLRKTAAIHGEIARKALLDKDAYVSSTLIDTYAKCGSLAKAQEVFDKLFVRDVVSWTALIGGYVEHGCADVALNFFEQMQQQGITADHITFVCVLKACGMLGDVEKGRQVAQKVFEVLPLRDLVFWNALIAGYAEHGHGEEAVKCYEQMNREGISLEDVTYTCLLKACGSIGAIDRGRELHAEVSKAGLERDLSVGSTLVDMYMKCGLLTEAQCSFDKLPVRGVVTWNALMAGYAETHWDKALDCFRRMRLDHVSPDAVTYVCCLKACASRKDIDIGHEIHVDVVREGLDRDLVVGSTLVDMYGKCGLLAKAREVFDKLPVHDAVSWNALISGYVDNGHYEEALNCFEQMQHQGICLHTVMFICTLKACASIGAAARGQKIHAEISRRGLERDIVVGSTLIDFYAKCGLLATAQKVFDKLPAQDVVSWNALIAGYTNHGFGKKALECFDEMQRKGVCPDNFTYACTLKVCGSSGVTNKNQELHAQITRKGFEEDLFVGSTLVDVYAKCGSPVEAQGTFAMLPVRDVVSWTALMAGYALQLGETHNVMHVLDRMIGAGIQPNLVTLVSILNAFSHAGQVDKGQMYFEAISNGYGVIPNHEHYTCMVDLLSRAGHMNEALTMIEKMPFHPGTVVWDTMLGACQKWHNVELGRHAFEHAVRLDEENTAAYVCMSNIYADAATQDFSTNVKVKTIEAVA